MKPRARDTRSGTIGGHHIRIDGKRVDINLARIVYRCRQCSGKLKRHNFGLKCKGNSTHRGFIHRDRVSKIERQQQQNINQLEEIYIIRDGKVTVK